MTDIEDQGSWEHKLQGWQPLLMSPVHALLLTLPRARHAEVAQSKAPVPVLASKGFPGLPVLQGVRL